MYRLLIADDEPLEREGLELMIKRAMPEQFLMYHAANGRMAIEQAEKHQPDIIFMDIKMPGIQGLEAVSVIQQKLPHTKIVVVTAYDYFTYAKEAISLGVKEYLLKPAKREQILSLLQKLIGEIEEEKKKRIQELESFENLSNLRPLTESECTLMLMLGTVQELNVADLSRMLDLEIQFGYAMVISLLPENSLGEKEQRRIYECVKHYIKSSQDCLVSPVLQDQIGIFFPIVPERQSDRQRMELLQNAVKTAGYVETQTGCKVIIGIGSIQKGIDGWQKSYKEAVLATTEGNENMGVRHFTDMTTAKVTKEEKQKIVDAFRVLDETEALKQFQDVYRKLIDDLKCDVKQVRTELISLFNEITQSFHRSGVLWETIQFADVDDYDVLQKMGEQQIVNIIQAMNREGEKRTNHLLVLAKQYIEERYTEDISMEQVANYVGLNPFYFSKLFKKQIGETFSDYVMNVRIQKAKQLMENHELSLKEICYHVGYKDPNYFSRVFKKCTNESPKEYRQKFFLKSTMFDR